MNNNTDLHKLLLTRDSIKIVGLMQKILKREIDGFDGPRLVWGVALDKDGSILNIELISYAGLNAHDFEPSRILGIPIQKQAATFVMIQNHSFGELEPTESDKLITKKLIQCGDILQMPMLDHLIIDSDNYYSFRAEGLMNPPRETDERAEAGSQKLILESDIEAALIEKEQISKYVAWLMHNADYPIELIMERTGLNRETIDSLINEDGEIDPDSHYESMSGNSS